MARALARATGRRHFLARAGRALLAGVGVASLPLLPVARGARAEARDGAPTAPDAPPPDTAIDGPEGDPKRCEYWRHCAIDGFACSCCGGSADACPPGSEMSPVTWIGTCRNPADGQHYVISYNDCCGKGFCGRCMCNRNEGDRPDYHWVRANDINWCAGAESQAYHCSVAIVVKRADGPQPER
ncbi:MAG: methylamine dehydrogenase light chain [Myxococcota bacterium]